MLDWPSTKIYEAIPQQNHCPPLHLLHLLDPLNALNSLDHPGDPDPFPLRDPPIPPFGLVPPCPLWTLGTPLSAPLSVRECGCEGHLSAHLHPPSRGLIIRGSICDGALNHRTRCFWGKREQILLLH